MTTKEYFAGFDSDSEDDANSINIVSTTQPTMWLSSPSSVTLTDADKDFNADNNKQSNDQALLQPNSSEVSPTTTNSKRPEDVFAKQIPIKYNPVSWVLLAWLDPLMWLGYKKPLEAEDLFAMTKEDQTSYISKAMMPYWQALARHLQTSKPKTINGTNTNNPKQTPSKSKPPSLSITLFRHFGFRWFLAGLAHAIGVGAQLLVPTFFQQIIYYLANDPYSKSELFMYNGVSIAFTIFGLSLVSTLFNRSYEQIARTVSINVRTALICAIYEKSLKLSGEASQEFSQGRILNLVNVDSETVSNLINTSHDIWITPAQVIVTIALLHRLLGNAVFIALGALLAAIFLQGAMIALVAMYQKKFLKAGDARLKLTREFLYAIKVIKLKAWETLFEKRITGLRSTQVRALRSFNTTLIVFVSLALLTPVMLPIVALIAYANNTPGGLNPGVVFPSLSLFQLLIGPLFILPSAMSTLIQAIVSYGRIRTFLAADETQPLKIIREDTKEHQPEENESFAIEIKNATFKWEALSTPSSKKEHSDAERSNDDTSSSDKKKKKTKSRGGRRGGRGKRGDDTATESTEPQFVVEPFFKNLNVAVPRGKLTCVVGPVGAGKSSLLSAIIGEMTLISEDDSVGDATVDSSSSPVVVIDSADKEVPAGSQKIVRGSVAYCAQQPWILTDTVEGNIIFCGGKRQRSGNAAVDLDGLKTSIKVTGLEPDLAILSEGIRTLIGEKGVNLSGGQQARVSLARAVYQDADIYLLDDPLAALDAHVGASVFENCIQHALSGKTRVLVTHQLQYLSLADNIIVLEKGKIAEQGSYNSLMASNGVLSKMMRKYKGTPDDGDAESNNAVDSTTEVASTESKELVKVEDDDIGVLSSSSSTRDDNDAVKSGSNKDIVEEEDRATGALQAKVWYSFFKAFGGWWIMVPVILMAIIQQGSQLLTNQWLTWWSSDQFQQDKYWYLKIYAGLGATQAVSLLLVNAIVVHGGYLSSLYYHNAALRRLLHAPMSFFESQPIGRILNRFSKDVDAVDKQIWVFYFQTIFSFTGLVGSLVLISVYFPAILALIGPLVIAYYFLLQFYRSSVRELKRLDATQRSPLYAHISESLSGISSIRAYKVERRFTRRQRLLLDLSNSPRYLYLCTAVWISIRIELSAAFIILTISLLGITGAVSPAAIGLSLTYAFGVVDNIGFLLKAIANLESEMNAVERLDFYANHVPMEKEYHLPSDPSADVWPSQGAVQVRDLELVYASRPDHPVIKEMNLDIQPGEKIGVVGRTGSGKSTLLISFFRILEANKGSISIDGIDIASLGLATLRSRLQIITQEPVLFSGTVRSNLDVLGGEEGGAVPCADSELWEVLDMIGLKDYVGAQPEKLDAPITENGKNLSVGQRQLMCLGRAILGKAKLLFLDEATASVDSAADALVQESIRTHFKHATVISIAHRLNTVAGFDRVLVLDEGRMVEFDRPLVLLDKPAGEGAIFRNLAEATGPSNFKVLRDLAVAHENEHSEKV